MNLSWIKKTGMKVPSQLDTNGYRMFGLGSGTVIALLFGLLFPLLLERPIPKWPWIVSLVLMTWALVRPKTLSLIHGPWVHFSHMLGNVVIKIMLIGVFFLLFTPISLLMRLMGRDPLCRKIESSARSYWQASEKQAAEHMERNY